MNDDGINSKNIIPGNGKITTELKQDWGLNDIWNELILPRFERMNQLTNSTKFTAWNENHQKFLPAIPLELSKGFSKKRIDHRHHAMDALVIACATREHINYMNNEHALRKGKSPDEKQKIRYDLRSDLCDKKYNDGSNKNYKWSFKKPWEKFTTDAREQLESIIISFKQNLRVINNATNSYEKWVEKDGVKVKELHTQKGINWAIRKPMHKDTVSGLIQLRKKKMVSLNTGLDNIDTLVNKTLKKEIQSLQTKGLDKKNINKQFKDVNYKWNEQDISKVEIYYWEHDNVASRVSLNDMFDENRIETITDTGIQKILINHLNNYKGRLDEEGNEIPAPLLAFSPEGIEEMNKNIRTLNNGRTHQPIQKVRTYEPKGNKFNVGQTGNKKVKYVEAAKGTNLFFAIYQNSANKRNYTSIPFNEVLESQKYSASLKQKPNSVPEKFINEKTKEEHQLLFHLSPNDIVYVPSEEERKKPSSVNFESLNKEQVKRIYKVVSFSGSQCFFTRNDIATSITDKVEFSALNKMEKAIDGIMIKENCWKLKVNRLGNISK
jgi:CRISPR-associated endonuclease Csn1